MANATTPVIQINEGNVGIGTATPSAKLDVQGTQGQLFSVTDDLSGSIFAVADISGVPIFDVNSSGTSYFDGNVGIGTDDPASKLHVFGGSANTELKVTTNDNYIARLGLYEEKPGNLHGGFIQYRGESGDRLEIGSRNAGTDTVHMSIDDITGNVGIGTPSPFALLTLKRDTGIGFEQTITTNVDTRRWWIQNDVIEYGDFLIRTASAKDASTPDLTRFYINNDGNVGIGTDTPGKKLDVAGEIKGTNLYAETYRSARTDGDIYIQAIAATDFVSIGTQVSPNLMRIDGGGNVGIGTTGPLEKLEVEGTMYATPIAYAASQGAYALKMGAYNNTAFDQGIKIKSTSTGQSYMSFNDRSEDALVLRGAKVGIGTDNPGYRLDVNGTGRFTSTVTATNFILSSDKRLKNNIKEIDTNYIDVNWKNFELKSEPGVKRAGVIAQELEEKHPEFVRTDDKGMKSVAYIDLLIAKIAELEARLEKAGI